MATDLLAEAPWRCTATLPGRVEEPAGLDGSAGTWWDAAVPGTAAGALREAGDPAVDWRDFDTDDWWFTCEFPHPGDDGPWRLHLEGLATVADVWCNDEHLLHSENMFVAHGVDIPRLGASNRLTIRCAALAPLLRVRRPRPRWKCPRILAQGLRWYRTSLMGRMTGWVATPAPVGPWRPVRLEARAEVELTSVRVDTGCRGEGGSVTVDLGVRSVADIATATLRVGEAEAELAVEADGPGWRLSGTVTLPTVERWWPHTHGSPTLYPVTVEVDGVEYPLDPVGFRTVAVDRSDGGFTVVVNEVPIYCRGACWIPLDPVSFTPPEARLDLAFAQMVEANLNMVRVVGETVPEEDGFYARCDRAGLLLWHDCMLAFFDPPEDADFEASMTLEVGQLFGRLHAHPCLAVVSGGSDIVEQAQLMGVPREVWTVRILDELLPALADRLLPGIPWVSNSPTGGTMATEPGTGIAHYYGVGAYFRPVTDVRRTGVRFAAECLSYATPPEPQTVDDAFGGAAPAGHDWRWKRAVHRDAGMSWDQEDARDHYAEEVFGVRPFALRHYDPAAALDVGRATVAHLFAEVLGEWRRPGSRCMGSLVFDLHDLRPGPGLGIVDAVDRPKAPWYVMRRVMAPTTVLVSDEGLNGLDVHVVHDGADELAGEVRIDLFGSAGQPLESVTAPVRVPGRGSLTLQVGALFDGFRDISYAHRFAGPPHDVLAATLLDADGVAVAETVHLPAGPARRPRDDLGLAGRVHQADEGGWLLEVSTAQFAQWVAPDLTGFVPEDSWFHLLPGASRTLALRSEGSREIPRGELRAHNATRPVPVVVDR
jgi:beta-mannosidase